MANTLDTVFGDHPWADYDTNQRTVYVPELLETYTMSSPYYRLIDYGVNLGAARTGSMVFTRPIDPDPNIQTLDNRALWLPRMFMDSQSVTITAERHGGKIQLHEFDDLITYWQEQGAVGLRSIMQKRVAPNMIQTLDLLARNAHISHFAPMFAGSQSDFGALLATNTFDPAVARAVMLGADYVPDPVRSPVIGMLSPSATYTFKSGAGTTEWIGRLDYADPARLLNYEIGLYEGVRFTEHPINVLWNCGEVLHQTRITAALNQGSGAAATVDGVYATGQASATNYIQVNNAGGFAPGDIITLHRVRNAATATTAVLNGVTYNDYRNITRRVVSSNETTDRIAVDRPILVDWYESVVAGTAHYGWVTKARSVHMCVFLKGPRGVVSGVLRPPQTHNPPPIDDTESVYRFSWDAYLRYQIMHPERFEIHFYAGPQRRLGEVVSL